MTAPSRILVVDDEPALGDSIDAMLSGLYDVTVSTSASDALRLILDGARFDAILSDVTMPGMSGTELYTNLRDAAPDQARRMIFMSGGSLAAGVKTFLDNAARPSIEKPFRLATLRDTMKKVLLESSAGEKCVTAPAQWTHDHLVVP